MPEKKIVEEEDKIWKEEDVPEIPLDKNEKRPRPEFEVLFK